MTFPADVVSYCPRLRRYASGLVPYQDVEDLVQETVLKALERASFYQGGNLFGWLSVMMNHICIDQRRSTFRRSRWQIDIPSAIYTAAEPPQQETIVLAHEMVRAMRALEAGQCKVLEMSLILEQPNKDIAVDLNIPYGTVLSRLSRGRTALCGEETRCRSPRRLLSRPHSPRETTRAGRLQKRREA